MLNRILQRFYSTPNNGKQILSLGDGRRLVLCPSHPWEASCYSLLVSKHSEPKAISDFKPLPFRPLEKRRCLGGCLCTTTDVTLNIAWSGSDGIYHASATSQLEIVNEGRAVVPESGALLGDMLPIERHIYLFYRRPLGSKGDALGVAVLDGDTPERCELSLSQKVFPPVAVSGGEQIYIAWHTLSGQLWCSKFDTSARTLTPPTLLDQVGRQPSLALDGERLLIVYEDDYPHLNWKLLKDGQTIEGGNLTMLHPWLTTDLVHSPQLVTDRFGVIWLFFVNSTRRCVFWARWLGAQWSEFYNGPGLFFRPPHFDWNLLPIARLSVHKDNTYERDIGMVLLCEPPLSIAEYRSVKVPEHPSGDSTIMFFDLLEVCHIENLELEVNSAEKHPGNPLMETGEGGRFDSHRVFNHGCVLFDKGRYRMWYGATAGAEDGVPWWDTIKVGYAESADGVEWNRVEIDETGTNLVPYLRHSPTMFKDHSEADPSRRYKSLYVWSAGEMGEMARTAKYGIDYDPSEEEFPAVLYTSADGVHLEPNPAKVVFEPPSVKPFSIVPQSFFRDPYEKDPKKLWKAYGFMSLNLRRRGGAYLYSPDGVVWYAYSQNPVLDPLVRGTPPAASGPHSQVHDTVVFPYERYYIALYQYQYDSTRLDIELAVSRDGESFVFVKPGEKVIPLGEGGEWDSSYIIASMPVLCEDEIRLYYGGGHYLGGTTDLLSLAILPGLAVLRPHRFTSLRLVESGTQGVVITLPFTMRSRWELLLNAQCSKGASLRVALLDSRSGEPLPRRSLEECEPFSGSELDHTVSWRGDSTNQPSRTPIRIAFYFRRQAEGIAKLFSYSLRTLK